jgi:S1-C subfamily serine protease
LLLLAAGSRGQPAVDELAQVTPRARQTDDDPQRDDRTERADASEPGYLGVIADDRGLRGRGVLVREVVDRGPADQAGLKPGDLVTASDGRPIRRMSDLGAVIEARKPGDVLSFTVERDGESQSVEVVLGKRPPPGERRFPVFGFLPDELGAETLLSPEGPRLGVRTERVTEAVRQVFRLPEASGALVTEVTPGSPADRSDLPVGAVIVEFDGQEVQSPEDLARAVEQASGEAPIEIVYFHLGREVHQQIKLPRRPGEVRAERPDRQPRPLDAVPGDFVPAEEHRARIAELERRIAELEKRIERLEAALRARDGQ